MEITKDIVNAELQRRLNPEILNHVSNKRKRFITQQQRFFVLLDLVKQKYNLSKLENQEGNSKITEGFVYLLTNPAFPGMVKIGHAIDVKQRLSSYQTADPYRSYSMPHYLFFNDRRYVEKLLHKVFLPFRTNGEWFDLDIELARNIMYLIGKPVREITHQQDLQLHTDIVKMIGHIEFERITH